MIKRDSAALLQQYVQLPVIGIFGPRQSGKTTLAQNNFKNHTYLSFEDPDIKNFAKTDPRGFLSAYENSFGIILDEFQHVPEILSYIQLDVDEKKRAGYFVITGSQNFIMSQLVSQSLAGRIGILTLLPFSLHELQKNDLLATDINEAIFKGCYPRIYDQNIFPDILYPSYIQTYIERDVRQLTNVGDLHAFTKFIKLCAARVGQLLNLSDIAGVCGISITTAGRWISILETSYIIFLLQPHNQNFNKRLTKSPKIFFYDTGLACSLLEIDTVRGVSLNPYKGNLFECYIVADMYKQYFNSGKRPSIYFWRDLNGRLEMDCIIEQENKLYPIVIKSSQTIASDYFKGLESWSTLSEVKPEDRFLIYGGTITQQRPSANIISWRSSGELIEFLRNR